MRLEALLNYYRKWIGTRNRDGAAGTTLRRRTYGQSLAEFALIAPVFLMMVLGVVDLGRVFYSYEALANATREGARYCALHAHDTYAKNVSSDTRTRVTDELGGSVSNLSVASPACDTSVVTGEPVTVTASTTFTPITPLISALFSGGTLTLTASATMKMQ